MKWLVTAFAPFAGDQTNSSQIVLEQLKHADVDFYAPLPVSFGGAWLHTLNLGLDKYDGVLGLGQAAGRKRVSAEFVALNVIDTRTPDNEGVVPELGPINAAGPAARWSGIAWNQISPLVDLERSYSAGQFVCNTWLYQALAWAESSGKQAGFIHIPMLRSQSESGLDDLRAVQILAQILEFLVAR